MKTMQQTLAQPDSATPMELAISTLEMMVAGARMAVQTNNQPGLFDALAHIVRTAQMVQGWISDNDPKAKA